MPHGLPVATKLDLSIMWVCRQRSRKRQCERKLHLCCPTFKTMPGRVGRNSCSMAPPKVKHMLTSALTGSQNSRPRHYLRRPSARQCRQVQRVSEVVVRRLISKLPATTATACSAPLLVIARPIDGYDGGPQSMAELLRELHLRQPQPNSTAPGCSGLLGKATPPPLPQVNDVHPTMMPLVALPNGFTVHGPSKLGVGWALAFGLTAMSVMSAFAAKQTYDPCKTYYSRLASIRVMSPALFTVISRSPISCPKSPVKSTVTRARLSPSSCKERKRVTVW
jgi:hypothetical protein